MAALYTFHEWPVSPLKTEDYTRHEDARYGCILGFQGVCGEFSELP